MKAIKRVACGVLMVSTLCIGMTANVMAKEFPNSGKCGKGVTWTYDDDT